MWKILVLTQYIKYRDSYSVVTVQKLNGGIFFFFFQQLAPEDAEEFIDYLIQIGKMDEAASKLAEIVNRVRMAVI